MKMYVINDWDELFENAQSRKAKRLQWVPVPNKHDGLGFRRVAAMRNRTEVFAGWILILELASKSSKRGHLLDSGGNPLTCTEMALKTGFPEATFEAAIEALKAPEIGWIKEVPVPGTGSTLPAHSHHVGAEGKGREEKERSTPLTPQTGALVVIPDDLAGNSREILDWIAYKRERRQAYKPKGLEALWRSIRKIPPDLRRAAVDQSMANNYQGLFAPKGGGYAGTQNSFHAGEPEPGRAVTL